MISAGQNELMTRIGPGTPAGTLLRNYWQPAALALVALATVSVVSFGADDETVRVPYVEVGDCWSYRTDNIIYQNKPVHDYELCVTLVDQSKGTILAVGTRKDDGLEIDAVYSLEWAGYASIWGLITPEGTKHFRFPLKIGDVYANEFEFRDSRLGKNNGKSTYTMKVVGWEEITVPAGTFRALKIEGHGMVKRYDRPLEFEQTITWWYSPKVNRHVKFWYRNPARSFGEELTGFKLNQ